MPQCRDIIATIGTRGLRIAELKGNERPASVKLEITVHSRKKKQLQTYLSNGDDHTNKKKLKHDDVRKR
jgi:hypothetical protein